MSTVFYSLLISYLVFTCYPQLYALRYTLYASFPNAIRNTIYDIRDKSLTIKTDFDILTKKMHSLSLTDNEFSKDLHEREFYL